MITIGYSTRQSNTKFQNYLKETCGLKNVEVIEKVNNGEKSLSQVYNEIIEESTNDILVLCHDDIYFEKKYWGKRLTEHFEKKTEFGILGVAGTTYYPSSGRWWDIPAEMVGQVYHQHNGKKWLSEYSKSTGSKVVETIIVDGLFICLHKQRIKETFDTNVEGFHFYDTTFCIKNYLSGVKIGVMSNIPICHLSIGMTNEQWEKNRQMFADTFKDNLPLKHKDDYPVLTENKTQPLVSVVVPIFNYGQQFENTLQSVFNSTYKNIEIVVVNDGSTDEYVLQKLDSIKNHPNIKVINQVNSGPSEARNNGIRNSNGEFILPLDADDKIEPEYIQSCVNILKRDKNISPVYCDTIHIGQSQGIEKRPEWSMDRLIQGPFIVNCSMFHKEAFDKCDGYDTSLFGWEDYDLWIRMGKNGYKGHRIPKPLFTYFHHEKDGTVSTTANQNQGELYKKIMDKNFKNEIAN
jgi:glycosyltransferase involved in cell wall biosynthesis